MAREITVVGYGRFGRALCELCTGAGHQVVAVDTVAEVSAEHLPSSGQPAFSTGGLVILSVPVGSFPEALASVRARLDGVGLVLDVSSVRAPVEAAMADSLGAAIPWVGSHPLFGPSSIATGDRPLRVVVCPNEMHPGGAEDAAAFYRSIGCEVLFEDPQSHDRSMAYSHALAFFLAKGMLDIDAVERTRFVPPSFQSMLRTIDAVRSDAGHLFFAIERLNPFADDARRELLDALQRLHEELRATDPERYRSHGGFEIPDLGRLAPELRETRELIDELDLELLTMLARRTELARRAGRIKGGRRLPVRDPTRERELLEERRAWAESLSLDAQAVARVFEAVLSLSRGVQEGVSPGAGDDRDT